MSTNIASLLRAAIAASASLLLAPLGALGQSQPDPFAVRQPLAAYAVFSCNDMSISGSAAIDSVGVNDQTVAQNGHVRSNGKITMSGSSIIRGNATPGPGKVVQTSGSASVTGSSASASATLQCVPVDLTPVVTAVQASNNNAQIPLTGLNRNPVNGSGAFSMSGSDSLTLAAGTYSFTGFSMSGSSTITLTGPVRILVAGNVSVSGGSFVNDNSYAFRFWSTGTSFGLSSSTMKAFVYAPNASVSLSSSRLTGSVFAKAVSISGSNSGVRRTIDDALPQVTITAPLNNAVVSNPAQVQVTGTASDGQTAFTLQVNGQPVTVAANGTFQTTLDLSGAASPATITAQVTDANGNVASTSVQVYTAATDVAPPAVTIVTPADGTYTNATSLLVTGTATDDVAVAGVTVNGVTATRTGQNWSATIPLQGQGPVAITATATDTSQKQSSATVTVVRDTTAPVLTVTSHTSQQTLSVRDVTLTGGSDDAVSVKINGADAAVNAGAGTFSFPLVLQEGANVLTVTGVDRAGNTGTATITLKLDTRAPELTVAATPACTNAETLLLQGTVADPNTNKVEVKLGEATILATLTGNTWTASVPLGAEGNKALLVEATDSVGHVTARSVTIVADRTAPQIELSESGTPFTATIADRAIALFVRATDADLSPIVTVTLDGAPFSSGSQVSSEGAHVLHVVARDCAGNETTRDHAFTIDLTAPRFLSLTPASGSKVTAVPASLSGTTDEDAVEVRVTGTAIAAPVTNGAFTIPNIGFADGINDRTLEVVDRAGHIGRTTYTLGVRTASPLVEILESGDPIVDGTVFRRAVEPRVRVFDPEVTFTATLNGAPFVSGTAITADAAYTIAATATDGAYGQTNTVTRTFAIDRSGPAVNIVSPADGVTVDADHLEVRVSAADAASVTVNAVAATKQADGTWLATAVPLDLGANTIIATGRDGAGNSGSDSVEVTRGGAGPALVLTFPPDLYVTNRTNIDVTGRVLRPGSAVAVVVPPASAVSAAVDAAGGFRVSGAQLAEGETTIRATATEGGKSVEVTARVIADFTAPLVRIFAGGQPLTDGAGFATEAVLTGEATDKGQPADYVLLLDGNVVAPPVTVTANGGHAVTITARDAAGNESRIERTFYVGSSGVSGCSLDAFDPPNNAVINSQRVELVGRSGGAAGVKVNGVVAKLANGSFCATVELPQEGANAVSIVCTDSAGTPVGQPESITLFRATQEPSVAILTPSEGSVSAEESVDVTGTLGNGAVSVTVNGKAASINGSNWTAEDVRLQDGINILVARATNAAGKTAAASRRVTYLQNGPTISITTPLPGVVTGTATVDVSGTWTNVHPSSLSIEGVAGAIATDAWSDTTGRFVAASVPLVAGDNTIRVSGRDRTGRIVNAQVLVKYVATVPAIAITSPADNYVFAASQGATFRVSGTFNAATGSSIDVNGVAATIDATAKTWFADVAFASTPNGVTPVVAQLAQPNGGSGAFDSVRVLKSSAAPEVLETFPAANAVEVDNGAVVLVLFSAPMDRTATAAAFALENAAGTAVNGTIYLDKDVLTFAPAATLVPGERYTIRVATSAKDLAGQGLAEALSSSFVVTTTAPGVAPTLTTTYAHNCAQLADVAGTTTPGARVRIDYGQVFFTTTASATGAFTYKVPLSGQQGYHVIRVRTIGADGTLSPAAELKLNVDCSGPRVLGASYDRTANHLTIVFSRDVNAATLTSGTVQLVLSDGSTASASISVTATNAVVTPSPSLADASFTLKVTTGVEDTQGRRLDFPYTQFFAAGGDEPQPGDGRGYIAGEVYDATTGRPLAGAEITIEAPTAAFSRTPSIVTNAVSTQAVTMATDARGRYGDRFPEGAHTIRASANGYTTAWRQIIVPAGAGVVPIDIRLTRLGETQTATTGALTLTHGGANAVTRRAELAIPAGAVPSGTSVTFTSAGAQSLAGLLPLGWSPLASGVVMSQANDLPNATLIFDVPQAAITAAAQTLAAVRYDESRDEWRVVAAAVNVANDRASFTIVAPGAYALVYPDRRPGLAIPSQPTAGGVLRGIEDPCVEGACPPMVARSFPLDPEEVLPTGSTIATLNIEGTDPHVYPSGTAVQAYIDEELRLADGGRELDPPFAADLLLYRDLDGDTGVAAFNLAPSARAAEVILEVGFDHIRVVPYPGRLDRGTLVGPEGGRVPADGDVAVEIPTGATPVELRATASSIPDPGSFGPIAGYSIVAGLQLTLQQVGADEGAVVELTRPARATFTIPQSSILNPQSQLLLVEVLDQTPYGARMFRLAAEMTALDATRWTTKPIDRAVLPVDGIVREGRYLLLAPQAPVAFAKGLVRIGVGGAVAWNARVITSGLGTGDLTRINGIFALPVPAEPAAPFSLVPRTVAHGDGAAYQHPAAPPAGTVVNAGDLVIVAQPPQVSSTSPANNATGVSLTTSVDVNFTPGIDPSSIGPSTLTVIDTTTGTTVPGTVSAIGVLGIRWTLPAETTLVQGRRYAVAVAPSVRGSNGASLSQAYTFSFTTAATVTNTQVHPELIRLTIPDANGVSRVIGAPGALPQNWLAIPVRRGRDFAVRYSKQVTNADGSFTLDIGTDARDRITVADEIDLRLLNGDGVFSAIIPLTPFVSEDGRAFVATAGSVTFTSADDIGVLVPAGAFETPTVIRVEPAQASAFSGVPRFDDELRLAGAVKLTFDGRARRPLDLRLPVLPGADLGRPHFLGLLDRSSRGPRIMAVDPLHAVGGALTTVRPSSGAAQHRFGTNTGPFQSNDPGDYTQGIIEAGQYAALDMKDIAGSHGMVWAFMDGLTTAVELFFDTAHSMYVGLQYVAESYGRIAFPVPAGVQFTVTGIDPATSLIAFEEAYSALPVGDPGVGTVIANPGADLFGPRPIFGAPFRIEAATAPPAGIVLEAIAGLRLTLSDTGNLSIEIAAPLAPETRVSVLHVPSGKLVTLPATIAGVHAGDQLVAMIEQKNVDPDASLSIVFNEAIDLAGTDPEDASAVSDFLETMISLEALPAAEGSPIDLLQNARLRLDSGDRRVTIVLPSPLPAGAEVRLTLRADIQDRSGNGLGLGQAGKKTEAGVEAIGAAQDMVLRFSTRAPAGTFAEFDIRQSGASGVGQIRELARYDNLMFVAAMNGGVLAYDLSDPAALDDDAQTKPVPVGQAPSNLTDYWAVQVDHHGRVFTTGATGMFGVLRTFRAEDFINAKANPDDACMSSVDNAVCRIVGAALVSQVPGSSSTTGIASAFVVTDRVEAIPRKVKIVVGDDPTQTYSREVLIDAFANGASTPVGSAGLVVFHPKVPATSSTYRLQRITIENHTLGLRWSADAVATGSGAALDPAEFRNVIAGPNDVLTVTHNRTTHAVVSLFGHGIAVYDVNAVESNDHPHQAVGAERPKEEVATKSGLSDLGLPPQSIADIRFSPDSEIVGISETVLGVYTLDSKKGIVDFRAVLPSRIDRAGELLFTTGNPRFDALKAAVLAAQPDAIARFNSSALYVTPAGRSYMLIPALQYGLLFAEVGTLPLTVDSFADVAWLPDGAYSVRVLDRSSLAIIIDGRGFAHLLDLTDIDERADTDTPSALFPTAAASIADGTLDPRILWTSDAPVAQGAGFIPPIVDPETGMMFSGDLLGRRMRVTSARDPKIRIVAETGAARGLQNVGTIVPLGIESPLPEATLETNPNASLAAFRVEVALPGSMQDSAGGQLGIAIESERISGVDSVSQTPLPYPRAHLRRTNAGGAPDARPVTVQLRRALDEAAFPELRYQRGYNRFVSDWIVAIADPRAARDYGAPPTDCASCARPAHLQNAAGVHELLTGGRFLAIRGDFSSGPYAFLAPRMTARVTTTPADTVRPVEALVAAQAPPVAEGMLQETAYVHSGEIETSNIDYDAGGRAGWNVLVDRTYRSRTIGLTPFGTGWDSALFRRLRALPDGDVEYRDGAEIWRFQANEKGYVAPEGLSLRLTREQAGWALIDQRQRITRFDDYGRIVSESDEFYDPREPGSGNSIVYLYDGGGRLTHVVDPVGRATTIAYDANGRVEKITDWHEATPRAIDYHYENGTLARVELPNVVNTSGARPAIRYAYEPAGTSYKPQLELATNLSTINDPGIATARVDFTYDPATDRVTSQKWATNETASFNYSLPASATITDALGHQRTYTLTGANVPDPISDRAHIAKITDQVEVWTGASPGQVPSTLTPAPPAVAAMTRTREFTYEKGALKSSQLAGIRKTELGWDALDGLPGLKLTSTRVAAPATSGGGAGTTSQIEYQFAYDGASAFLQSVTAGGKSVQTPEPHRYKLQPQTANDSINETQKYDRNGRLFAVDSTGGTDPEAVPASSIITYWPDDAPKHVRGLPRISRVGELATTYTYPNETTTIVTDPRLVKTTTECDTWDRPKRITIEKPGDPVVITESYTYDASGRVKSLTRGRTGGDVVTTYVYDDLGRQTEVSTNQIATVGTMTAKTAYDYAARRVTSISPGGATTAVDLDGLGRTKRSLTSTGGSPIDQHVAYDIASNPVFSTDLLTATASAYDLHGRAITRMHADGTLTAIDYDDWNRPIAEKAIKDDHMSVVGDSAFSYTDAGRLLSATTKVDPAVSRATSFAWDAAGRTTGVATNGRATRSVFDDNGRLTRSVVGAGSATAVADAYISNEVLTYDGWLPHESLTAERSVPAVRSTTTRNATGNTVESSIGPLRWKQAWDSIGNLTSASEPSRAAATFKTDARGAVEIETMPDGAVNQYAYDDAGAQKTYTDPVSEPTSTINDLLGRPVRRDYVDGTSEVLVYEGARLRSMTDRQGRQQTYVYNPKGQLHEIQTTAGVLDRFAYDDAGRMTSWKNADSELTWSDFDMEGRPKKTGQTRFREGSGLGGSPNVLDRFEQTHTYNAHGERVGVMMPSYTGMTFGAGWTASLTFDYDPLGNLAAIKRQGNLSLMTASYRGAGRPASRTVTTASGAPIVRTYGYDDQTSLLNRMSVEANGIVVAGSAVERDGLQLTKAQLLGVASGERYMHWRYDARSRLAASIAGVPEDVDPAAPVPGRAAETLTPADFRTAQPRTSFFDPTTASNLEAKGIDTTTIDPPTTTYEEQPGHKIAEATRGDEVRSFAWNGSERLDDGRFVYTFDAKGRLIRATEKGTVPPRRRFVYQYSGANRVIGRRAEYTTVTSPQETDWQLETRAEHLEVDGLPAETTFVWDPLTDTIAAVFKAGPTVADAHGGLLKQIVHGGAAYDDPIETTTTTAGGSVQHLYPVYDEAGAGSLQVVLDDAGKLVARTLPTDPYGAENVDFTGPAIDRVAIEFEKNQAGEVTSVEVTIHATEQLDPASLAAGLRLASVDAEGDPVRIAAVNAELDSSDPFTVRWSLDPSQFATLTDPTSATIEGTTRTPVSLSIAATTSLRALGWASERSVMPAPEWAAATQSIYGDRHPFEVREPLTSLTDPSTRKLYDVEELSLLGMHTGDTLIEIVVATRFQALPLAEPAAGLVYVRNRWYDPSTGTFLSSDALRYKDSSNLYAFASGDPVTGRDPLGLAKTPKCFFVQGRTCGDLWRRTVDDFMSSTFGILPAGGRVFETPSRVLLTPGEWVFGVGEKSGEYAYLLERSAFHGEAIDLQNPEHWDAAVGAATDYMTLFVPAEMLGGEFPSPRNATKALSRRRAASAAPEMAPTPEMHVPSPSEAPAIQNRVSKRRLYMGGTPGKTSPTGREVMVRMFEEGKLRVGVGGLEIQTAEKEWITIAKTDMSHIEDAVVYWNREGYLYGPKSVEVRKWMRDPNNYELEHYAQNRSRGGKTNETYRLPAKK